jgi:hypothetical protein
MSVQPDTRAGGCAKLGEERTAEQPETADMAAPTERCALRRWLLVCLLPALFSTHSKAQDSTHIHPVRLAVVSGVTLGTVIPVHIYQRNAWWQGPRAPFVFVNDWSYALNIDKLGHLYSGYLLSRLFGYSLRWSGFNEETSTFYGSILGLSYQLYVEVEDGFHRYYGFSPGDAFSNMIGATIPLAQQTFPLLRNFSLKYSYYPSSRYLNDLKAGQARAFIDDYQGMTVWLAVDPHFMMGDELAASVPSWLGFAFGAGVRDLDQFGDGRRVFYLTLDYNLAKIKTGSEFLHSVFTALDFIHFPAPGIMLDGKRVRVGVFYP